MPLFSPFAANPIVPSYYSLIKLKFQDIDGIINFVFPTSFPSYEDVTEQPLASIVMFENSGGSVPSIFMPNAQLGAIGSGTVFMNTTSSTVEIKNFGQSGTVTVLLPQTTQAVYLSDNSTTNGEWQVVPLNQPSAPVSPSMVAGGGLYALGNRLVVVNKVQDATTSAMLPSVWDQSYANYYYNYTGSTFNWTLTAPPTVPNGFSFYIKNSGVGILTITPNAGSTIDGSPSAIVLSPNTSTYLISKTTGVNATWYTFGKNNSIPSSVQFSTQGIQLIDGSQSLPSLAFISDITTGIFSEGTGNISVTAGGQKVATFESTGTNPGINVNTTGGFIWQGVPILYFNGFYP